MYISSHQPSFLPWTGFWHKLLSSDLHVASCCLPNLDRDTQNRVKLEGQWLTIPVVHKTRQSPTNEILYADVRYAGIRLEKTLCIKRYKYHERIRPLIEWLKEVPAPCSMQAVNVKCLRDISMLLGYKGRFAFDFVMPDPDLIKSVNLRLRIGRYENLTEDVTYLSGVGTAAYLKAEKVGLGCKVKVQKIARSVPDETIMQVIAREENPRSYVLAAGSWVDL